MGNSTYGHQNQADNKPARLLHTELLALTYDLGECIRSDHKGPGYLDTLLLIAGAGEMAAMILKKETQ